MPAAGNQVELEALWKEHLKGDDASGFNFRTLRDGTIRQSRGMIFQPRGFAIWGFGNL